MRESNWGNQAGELDSMLAILLVLLDLLHELGERQRVSKWIMPGRLVKGMDMPAARVVHAKEPTAFANESKGRGICLLVVEGVYEAA